MAKPPRNALLRGLWPGLRMGQTAGIVERLRWRKHPPAAATMALWCNWLTRRPLKAESPGSSPGNATKYLLYNQLLTGCKGAGAKGASLLRGYFRDTLFPESSPVLPPGAQELVGDALSGPGGRR